MPYVTTLLTLFLNPPMPPQNQSSRSNTSPCSRPSREVTHRNDSKIFPPLPELLTKSATPYFFAISLSKGCVLHGGTAISIVMKRPPSIALVFLMLKKTLSIRSSA